MTREHLRNKENALSFRFERGDELFDFGGDFRSIWSASTQNDLDAVIEGGEGAQQERQPLLARDSSNEDDGGGMRIDAVSLVNIGRRIRLPRGDIDAVMHDVDARGIYFRV